MTANIDRILQSGSCNERFYSSDPCQSLGSLGLAMLGHFSQMVSVHSPAFAPIKKVMRECTIQLALGVYLNKAWQSTVYEDLQL